MKVVTEYSLTGQLNEDERRQMSQGYGVDIQRWCLVFESEQEAIECKEMLEALMGKRCKIESPT